MVNVRDLVSFEKIRLLRAGMREGGREGGREDLCCLMFLCSKVWLN